MTYGIGTFEGIGANGTAIANNSAITAGVTAGFAVSVSLAGTGSVKVDTSHPHRGGSGLAFGAPAAGDIARVNLALAGTQAVMEPYLYCTSYPPGTAGDATAEQRFLEFRSASAFAGYLTMRPDGLIRLYDASGQALWLSPSAVPLNAYTRYSFGDGIGSAASSPYNGVSRLQTFSGADLETSTPTMTSGSYAFSQTPTAANTGTANQARMSIGKLGGGPAWSGLILDDFQFNDGLYTLLGPVTGALPVISEVIQNIWRLNVTGTSGSPATALVRQSGPTVTVTSPSAGIFEVELPNPFTTALVMRLTATNSAGPVTKDYTISPAGSSNTVRVTDVLYHDATLGGPK